MDETHFVENIFLVSSAVSVIDQMAHQINQNENNNNKHKF